MRQNTLYCAGFTPALQIARQHLAQAGIPICEKPGWDTGHLLLDVPSFSPERWTEKALDTLLASLPGNITIWGGNLDGIKWRALSIRDLLKEESYLQGNAAITADCTMDILKARLDRPWKNLPVLIIGWGRIGKALASRLKTQGCLVTAATGSEQKQKEIRQQGCQAMDSSFLSGHLEAFRVIINTAPALVLTEADTASCPNALKVDLASRQGIIGDDVLWARGLPARFAPERSGKLIADTILQLWKEEEK